MNICEYIYIVEPPSYVRWSVTPIYYRDTL